ncbi:hypothetical protein [Sphaerisporangium sp. NPDC051011]|uniref:hypothetical protein n=1 Tax=Sphaerisporangium sp. NPDC051011 TaxID=3155792 RepID=UPI0033ED85A5
MADNVQTSQYAGQGPHVDIHAQTAHLGLTQWDTAATGVTSLWKSGTERLQRLVEAAPWGRDTAGTAFLQAYTKDGGTDAMIRDGDRIMKDIDTLGTNVRTAVTTTRHTDQSQADATRSI